MKLLIVGLGSMGKRRARLSKGIDAALHIVGVDTAEARRAEACTLGLADAAYPTIAEAVAAEHPDAALVCTAPLSHAAVIGELLDNDLPVFTELNLVGDGYAENMAKAAAKNLPLFLSSTMLYRRETQYIKQQVQAFGKPVHYIYHIGQYLTKCLRRLLFVRPFHRKEPIPVSSLILGGFHKRSRRIPHRHLLPVLVGLPIYYCRIHSYFPV